MKRILSLVIVFLVLATGITYAATPSYPDYKNYVNDYTGTLSQATVTNLDKELFNLQKQNGDQIAVAVVATTGDESIEDYSIHLTDKWHPGQKGKDNGVLFLIAKDDHHMRIEVGRGLEGTLTDVQAQDIENNVIVPAFKAGDYDKGVTDGTNAIVTTLGGHVDSSGGAVGNMVSGDPTGGAGGYLILFAVIALIILVIGGVFASGNGDGFLGGALTGGAIGSLLSSSGDDDDDSSNGSGFSSGGFSGSSFGGFGGGSFSGGGASASW